MSTSSTISKKKHSIQSLIKVVTRIRPLSKTEKDHNIKSIVKCHTQRELYLKEKKYTFDKVFKPASSQIELYMNVVSPLIQDVVEGYNCTVFAYGQTGSGKTYTMTGEKCDLKGNWKDDEDAGIIPRAAFHIFDELSKMTNVNVSVKVSYIELYNEEIRDLLSDDENPLQLYTDSKGGVLVQGVKEVYVSNGEGICKLLQRGIVKRQIAPTLMNHNSSRSHTAFTILFNSIEATNAGDVLKAGKINLVDLAGSENIARSGCKDMRATELSNINRSLLTLGRVMTALAEKTQKYVPYRDSKLTRILQDSLGGHAKTVIIATVSPASNSYEESTITLDYASRARDIKNTPTINEKLSMNSINKNLVNEIDRLQKDLDAARNGTGFYVDKDNYQRMLDAIAAVTGETLTSDELADRKAQRITNLEDLMYSKAKQFEETVRLCKEHKTELESTMAALHEKDEILEQERFLSKWYENQTSEKLEEARRLLSTTRTLYSEKEILLAKLEHQFSINVSNETITQKAVTDVANMLDRYKDKETEKIKLLEENAKDNFKKGILELQKDVSNSSGVIKELSDHCQSKVRKENGFSVKNCILTKSKQYLNTFREKFFALDNVLTEYKKQLNILKLEVPRVTKEYKKNKENFYINALNLMRSAEKKYSKRTNIIEEQNKQTLEHLNDTENTLKRRIEEEKRRIEEDSAALIKIKKRKEDLAKTNILNRECISNMTVDLEETYKESCESLEKCLQLPNLIDIQDAQIQEIVVVIKEFEEKLEETALFLDEKHQKMTIDTLDEFNKSILNACQVIEKTLEEKVNGLIESIDDMAGKTEMIESLSISINNIKEILFEQILNKNVKARHLGDTPIRQSTSYPTKIREITPREALIEQFKKSTMAKLEETSDEENCEEDYQ